MKKENKRYTPSVGIATQAARCKKNIHGGQTPKIPKGNTLLKTFLTAIFDLIAFVSGTYYACTKFPDAGPWIACATAWAFICLSTAGLALSKINSRWTTDFWWWWRN